MKTPENLYFSDFFRGYKNGIGFIAKVFFQFNHRYFTFIFISVARSDNLAAAAVIVIIGAVVCVLAGIVLYRKVKEWRKVEKGFSYDQIDSERFLNEDKS